MPGFFIGFVFGGILGIIIMASIASGAMADLRSEVIRLREQLEQEWIANG